MTSWDEGEGSRAQRGEMERKKGGGLEFGAPSCADFCRRGRKQLRGLGPWGLNGEDRIQPHAESFSSVGGCLRR